MTDTDRQGLAEAEREALVLALGCMYHEPGYGECAACSAHAEQVWDDAVERILSDRLAPLHTLADEWQRKASELAPEDDWGESTGVTAWADCLRTAADDLRAALGGDR